MPSKQVALHSNLVRKSSIDLLNEIVQLCLVSYHSIKSKRLSYKFFTVINMNRPSSNFSQHISPYLLQKLENIKLYSRYESWGKLGYIIV